MAGTAAKKKTETETSTPNGIDFEALAKKAGEEMAKNLNMDVLKDMVIGAAEELGYDPAQVDEQTVVEVWDALPKEKKNPMLRKLGVTPKVGVLGALLGIPHHIEHLITRGAGNKIMGFTGLFYQAVAWGLAGYLGIDWYRNRSAA